MPILGSGNNDSLSLSGNTTQNVSSSLGNVPMSPFAPTNYTNLLDNWTKDGNFESTPFRMILARRNLNAASEDPGAFGGIDVSGTGEIGATIAIRPSGGSFPNFSGFAKSRVLNNRQNSHPALLPFGYQAGDLLLSFITSASSATISTPGAWTSLFDVVSSSVRFKCVYKTADGGEGSSVSFTTSSAQESVSTTIRIKDFLGIPEAATIVNGDPPNLTPSWGANNTLWIAVESGLSMLDSAINNGPEGSIHGYYKWLNGLQPGDPFFYAGSNVAQYRNRHYYTSASSPSFLIFPNTSLSINDFYFTSPADEWSMLPPPPK